MYEYTPGGKEYADRNQNARRIRELCRILVKSSKRSNETFNRQRDYDDHEESRQESSHAGRRTDISVTNDFFLEDSLGDLQCDDRSSQ